LNKTDVHIALVESSLIICEGLSEIIMQSHHKCHLYRFESYDEMLTRNYDIKINMVLLNPVYIQARLEYYLKVKLLRKEPWIGILYSEFPDDLLDKFDELINIRDSSKIIISKINKFVPEKSMYSGKITEEHLSTRETEVLSLLVKGFSNKEIADKLHISTHTVISHRKNIVQKTGIKSQSGLTIYAITKKIISINEYGF